MKRTAVALTVLACGLAAPGGAGGAERAGSKATLKAKVGWGPIADRRAARKVERTPERLRPENRRANRTVPTRRQLRYFHRHSDMPYHRHVSGRYRGSTDDIIEWAANKWGLPEQLLRAVAVKESWWRMSAVGDDGDSFGLFQMRRPYHCCLPFMRDSTAFNADYYGGIIRAYYDGKMKWLNSPGVREENGARYRAGDLWGSVGAWYSGRWRTGPSLDYVRDVRRIQRERTWATDPWF